MRTSGKFWLSVTRAQWELWKKYVPGERATHLFLVLWVFSCLAMDHLKVVQFLNHQILSPTEFRFRRWAGKSPSLSPRLKIFAFDDLAIKLIGEAYFPHELWSPMLKGLAAAKPSMILSAAQLSFEKKGLPPSVVKSIEDIPSLGAPLVTAAIFSPNVLPNRTSLTDPAVWKKVNGLENVRAFDYDRGFAYGPEGHFRGVFRSLGHVHQPWNDSFAPLVTIQKDQLAPHIGLHASRDWEVKGRDLYLDGKRIPIDQEGRSAINFLDPSYLVANIKTIVSLFPKINSGDIDDLILPGDVVLIIGSFGTGASSFLDSPFGAIPNAYFLASIINSVMTGEWLETYDFGWSAILLGALLGYILGWRVSTKLHLPVVLAIVAGIGAIDILAFTFLSAKLLIAVPTLTLIGASAISFNSRLRDEQRRKLSSELEQKTAAILQRDFLPPPQTITEAYEILCHYQAAQAVGGDWYSYYRADDRWLFLHVADVTGHGTASALCASYAKGSIDAIHRTLGSFPPDAPPLDKIHERLNHILNREGSDRLLITMVSIALDLEEGRLWHFNSGHPPGVLISGTSRGISHLKASGSPILGLGAEFSSKSPQFAAISPGDYVVLYTDGLSSHVKKLIRRLSHPGSLGAGSPLKLETPQSLQNFLLQLKADETLSEPEGGDDVTLIIVQFKSLGSAHSDSSVREKVAS